MTYPGLDTVVNSTQDVTQLLVYANIVSSGLFGPMMLYSFFLVVLLGGYFAQKRFSGRAKLDTALMAAAFATFGLSVIMSMTPGLLGFYHILITLGLCLLGIAFVVISGQQ